MTPEELLPFLGKPVRVTIKTQKMTVARLGTLDACGHLYSLRTSSGTVALLRKQIVGVVAISEEMPPA